MKYTLTPFENRKHLTIQIETTEPITALEEMLICRKIRELIFLNIENRLPTQDEIETFLKYKLKSSISEKIIIHKTLGKGQQKTQKKESVKDEEER